ncbi:hypothetical protein PYK79_52895 [Streptomyces sp. ID05-04B]|uniref:hypothetical protein n=1 Tax=Streptomyces sp. ID05-04B TaxID=3028661 RepID=UPI0029C296CE|nr:hypothetical protein [Streptomyces sp. ID05-04B]MDX5570262.1 hypothetical protein [Streptomyces sp. ID05-04B]
MLHIALVAFCLLYSAVVVIAGDDPRAPLVFRWPHDGWEWIRRAGRRPVPAPPRPDYTKIARLERELGLTDDPPTRVGPTVCLTKRCAGDTTEITTWSGQVLRRLHRCEPPVH